MDFEEFTSIYHGNNHYKLSIKGKHEKYLYTKFNINKYIISGRNINT